MVFTETINYHANHIGAIQTNKEHLKQTYNVGIVITRNRFGNYQEVDITGSTKDIKNKKKHLQEIVDVAEYEYQQYRKRKENTRRKHGRHSNISDLRLPTIKPKIKKSSNPFEILNEIDNGAEYCEEFPSLINSVEVEPVENNTRISWADMMD